jgi:hypothetical protein
MPACKQCGACLWDTAEVKGGPNAGREYSKCRQCGKFGAFVDGQPSLKPREEQAPQFSFQPREGQEQQFSFRSSGPVSPFESKAAFQSPMYSPPARSDPVPIPRTEPRGDPIESPGEEEPPRKRARVTEGFSEAMLNLLAGFGTIVKKFDAAAITLEKLAVALTPHTLTPHKDENGNASGNPPVPTPVPKKQE